MSASPSLAAMVEARVNQAPIRVSCSSSRSDNRPVLKVGVVEKRAISAGQITQMADLPPHEHLLASIAGSLDAPVAGIVGVLNAVLRDVAYMVEEVARKQEAAGD